MPLNADEIIYRAPNVEGAPNGLLTNNGLDSVTGILTYIYIYNYCCNKTVDNWSFIRFNGSAAVASAALKVIDFGHGSLIESN